jgi:regulator of nucleoside diphosphate kinase
MDSLVTVREVTTGRRHTYRLAFPNAVDESAGCVSILSEFGLALLGSRRGEIVKQTVPAGTREVEIESILYQPEHEQYGVHSQ